MKVYENYNKLQENIGYANNQGKLFNSLQNAKTSDVTANRIKVEEKPSPEALALPEGADNTLYKEKYKIIENFASRSNIDNNPTAIAKLNNEDLTNRKNLSDNTNSQVSEYQKAINNFISETKNYAKQTRGQVQPKNIYIAQSVSNPTISTGSTAVGTDYIPSTKSSFGNSAEAGPTSSGGIICPYSDKTSCEIMCQARTFDEGGVGFTLQKNNKNEYLCSTVQSQSDLDEMKEIAQQKPQNMALPGGSWQMSGRNGYVKGNVLHAQLRDTNGAWQDSSIVIPTANATFWNRNGQFEPDFDAMGVNAINFIDKVGNISSKKLDNNLLTVTAGDESYSTDVSVGDTVTFEPAPGTSRPYKLVVKANPYTTTSIERSIYEVNYDKAGGDIPDDVSVLGTFRYLDNNGQVELGGDNGINWNTQQYNSVGKFQATNQNITSKASNPTSCRTECDNSESCKGYVFTQAGPSKPTYTNVGNRYCKTYPEYTRHPTTNVDECKALCGEGCNAFAVNPDRDCVTYEGCSLSEPNETQTWGYTYYTKNPIGTEPASCYLMNENDWPKSSRIYNKLSNMNLKLPKVNNMPPGCPNKVDIANISSINNKPEISMPTEGCGISRIIVDEMAEIKNQNDKLSNIQNDLQNNMSNLIYNQTSLENNLTSNVDKIKNNLSEYEDINENAELAAEGINQANAKSEDTNIQLISENYNYLLWSILAITLVIGGIRASRN